MEYTKPHLSCAQQADKLINQGLVGNRETIEQTLASVSYYRLSAYWHPFRYTDPQSNATPSGRMGRSAEEPNKMCPCDVFMARSAD